jgi:hypothetical protein
MGSYPNGFVCFSRLTFFQREMTPIIRGPTSCSRSPFPHRKESKSLMIALLFVLVCLAVAFSGSLGARPKGAARPKAAGKVSSETGFRSGCGPACVKVVADTNVFAGLSNPAGVSVDGAGDVYIASACAGLLLSDKDQGFAPHASTAQPCV